MQMAEPKNVKNSIKRDQKREEDSYLKIWLNIANFDSLTLATG